MTKRRQFMITKNDMARVVVQALYNLSYLPDANNVNVKRVARQSKEVLAERHKLALRHFEKLARQ